MTEFVAIIHPQVPTDLVSWWTMDESSGVRYDKLKNNHLEDLNTVGFQPTGKIAGATSHVAANQESLEKADPDRLTGTLTDWAFGAWVKPTGTLAYQAVACSSLDRGNQVTEVDYVIWIDDDGWWTVTIVGGGPGTSFQDIYFKEATSAWQFVVVSYDAENKAVTMWIDGVNQGTFNHTNNQQNVGNTFTIGFYNWFYLTAEVDEAFFFRRQLQQHDIAMLYNSGVGVTYEQYLAAVAASEGQNYFYPEQSTFTLTGIDATLDPSNEILAASSGSLALTGVNATLSSDQVIPLTTNLVSWWSMNETSGTRADSHGSKDMNEVNGVGFATGKQGNAANFIPASFDHLENTTMGLDADADWTLAGWFLVDSVGASDRFTMFFFSAGVTTAGVVYLDTYGTNLRCYTYVNGSYLGGNVRTVAASTWYHAAVVFDASAGTYGEIRVYVNDTLELTITLNNTPYSETMNGFRFGRNNTAVNRYLDGRLDEWAYWDRALSEANISTLYASGSGIAYGDL